MMKNKRILIIIAFFIAVVALPISVSADATVDVIPEQPKPLAEVEITAKITDTNISNAYLIIQECDEQTGVCYSDENYSMAAGVDGIYTHTFTLQRSDADYFQYSILIQTSDGWQTYNKDTKVNLDTSTSDNQGSNGNSNDTPGFEFIALTFSIIFILLLVYKQKR